MATRPMYVVNSPMPSSLPPAYDVGDGQLPTCGQLAAVWSGAASLDDMDSLLSPNRPDLVLETIARQHRLDRPYTLLARVDGPPEQPEVVASDVLWYVPPLSTSDRDTAVERTLARLGLPRWSRDPDDPLPWVVPVVVRPGPCAWSWDEDEVMLGLRYGSNGFRTAERAVRRHREGLVGGAAGRVRLRAQGDVGGPPVRGGVTSPYRLVHRRTLAHDESHGE